MNGDPGDRPIDPYGYDELPYPAAPYPYSNPDHLAVLAQLFGLPSQPVDQCHVIEFGCADGSNLIPLAARFPDSQFVGIDLSHRQIESGNQLIESLGLDNVTLRQADLHTWESEQRFDYAIAHGFYSWTPPSTRQCLLATCRRILSPKGIAFVSYNVLPGWQTRLALRNWLLARHPRSQSPHVASWIESIRASIHQLRKLMKQGTRHEARALNQELLQLERWGDAYLRHDLLEDYNHPVSFATFRSEVEQHGLRFFAEADLASMVGADLDDAIAAELPRAAETLELREQLLDLVTQRTFRQSLLCHIEQTPLQQLGASSLETLYAASTLAAKNPDCPEQFQGAGGFQTTVVSPLVAKILEELHRRWPQAARLDEIIARIQQRSPADGAPPVGDESSWVEARAECAAILLAAFAHRAATLHTVPSAFCHELPPAPAASRLSRLQAQTQSWVTNLAHDVVALDRRQRQLLQALDGTRSVDQLAAEFAAEGEPHWVPSQLKAFLRQALIARP